MALRQELVVIFLQLLLHCSRTSAAEQGTSPLFTKQPSNMTAHQTATLHCSTVGSPQPSVEWFKDGTALVLSSQVSVDSNGALVITGLQGSDAGAYHCVASNALGSVRSSTAHLDVASLGNPPGPTGIQILNVIDRQPLVLSCQLPESNPHPPSVTWPDSSTNERVGVVKSTGELVFSYFIDGDANPIHKCSVTNSIIGGTGVITAQYFLSREEATALSHDVEFHVRPQSVQVLVTGETLYIECFTTGLPVADISWLKDDTALSAGGRVTYSQNGRELEISSTTPTDSATYTCVASQATGTEIRASGDVTIVDPPMITATFLETDATITQPLTLNCRADQGTPPLQWEWLYNGEPLTMTTDLTYTTSGTESTLTIFAVDEAHGGVYQCVVRQPLTGRSDNANELVNIVRVAPMFTHDMPEEVVVFDGSKVTLPCQAEGYPVPTFKWYRAGSQTPISIGCGSGPQSDYCISDSPRNGSLTISNAGVGDSSVLACEATNSESSVRTDFVTLRVVAIPMVTTAPPTSLTPSEGTDVTLNCAIAPSAEYSVSYRWTREGVVIPHSSSGTLTVSSFTADDNGVYTCIAILDIHGLQMDLHHKVGSSVITVGAPPTAPTPPLNPTFTLVTASGFTAHWQTPVSDGGLPLRNYSIEVFQSSRLLCSGQLTWVVAEEGVDPSATVAMVTGLHSAFEYRFRVVAFNHQFRATSVDSQPLTTLTSTPRATPTIVSVSASQETEALLVSWVDPSPCSSHGGPLTGYTVQYRVRSEQSWRELSTESRDVSIPDLLSDTAYDVRVAASTSAGQGPFSEIETGTTREAPLTPPTGLTGTAINTTSVRLTWEATPTATSYIVTYVHPDGQQIERTVTESSLLVTDLVPNSRPYTFRIAAIVNDVTGPTAEVEVSLPGGLTTGRPIYEEVWFIAVVAVAGALLVSFVMIICAVVCYKCCCKCGRDNGKIYITSRRSASSMSGGSSGFSEYQHKHKVNAITKSIKVHSSPTPSRRSTDYADMDSLRPAPSVTPASYTFTDSLRSDRRNGHYPQRDHMTPDGGHMIPDRGHMTSNGMRRGSPAGFIDDPNDQIHTYPSDEPDYPLKLRHEDKMSPPEQHIRHLSGGVSQPFFDTLNRVHTPPPAALSQSSEQYPDRSQSPAPRSYQGLSQETSDSWNPMDNLNQRGHMTNNPVSRSNSNRSSQMAGGQFSSACSTPQKVDLGTRKWTGPLSPVHEQSLRSSGHGMSMQEFPPRSNSVHGNMSMSTGHISHLDHRHNTMGAHTRTNVDRQPPVGMELGTMTPDEIQQRQLPQIPYRDLSHSTSPIPNPHSVEYSTIPPVHVSRSEQFIQPGNPPVNRYPPPTTSPPPPTASLPSPPEFRHSPEHPPLSYNQQPAHTRQHSSPPHTTYPESHDRQLSSPPLLQQRSPSPVYSAPQVKPKPLVRRNLQNGFNSDKFEQIPMQALPQRTDIHSQQLPSRTEPHGQHFPQISDTNGQPLPQRADLHNGRPMLNHYPQHNGPENSGSSGSNGVSRSEESWPLDDLQRQFESDIQDLEALQNMLTPVVTDPQQSFLLDQAQAVAINDGGPVLPRDNGSMSRNLSVPSTVQPRPVTKLPTAPKPHKSAADINTHRQTSTSSTEDPNSLAINKQRPNVPHLSQLKQLDPRKPKKLYGKVRGAVWQPRSMNRVIESSSESESESESDMSLVDTVVDVDTVSMRSSHV